MWATENRQRYDRRCLRYPSDLTDAEWTFADFDLANARKFGEKAAGVGGGFGRHDPHKYPACGAINRHEQISTGGLVGHLG